ncbi:hypothetical protein [Endozoicomonas sp. 2B-B]
MPKLRVQFVVDKPMKTARVFALLASLSTATDSFAVQFQDEEQTISWAKTLSIWGLYTGIFFHCYLATDGLDEQDRGINIGFLYTPVTLGTIGYNIGCLIDYLAE